MIEDHMNVLGDLHIVDGGVHGIVAKLSELSSGVSCNTYYDSADALCKFNGFYDIF